MSKNFKAKYFTIMKTIFVILNGINLPYHVIEYVIDKAKTNSCEIFALFLKGSSESPKGYVYPSDLGATATLTSEADGIKADEKIISQNMKIVRDMADTEKIPYRAEIKTNASADEVVAMSATADLIVIDENFDEMSLLSDPHVSLKDLMNKTGKPLHPVPYV